MMKIKNIWMTVIISTFSLLSSTSVLAQASLTTLNPSAGSDPIVQAIDNARAKILAQLEATTTQLNKLFQDAFESPFSLTVHSQVPNLAMLNPAGDYVFEGSSGSTQKASTPYELVTRTSQQLAAQKLQVVLSNENRRVQRQVLLDNTGSTKESISAALDAQNFFMPSYTSQNQNNAERTLAFLSDTPGQLGSIDLAALDAKATKDKKIEESAKTYRVKVYTNAAMRSLFLKNLYDSFNARVPIKGLAERAGMPNQQGTSASLMEVEKYTASRRIKNPEWYQTINSAPSVAVQREIAFTLAEIQWQLYQLHQDNEKMLQTMTAIGVLNARSSAALADMDEVNLKQEVEGTKPAEPNTNISTTGGISGQTGSSPEPGAIPPIPR